MGFPTVFNVQGAPAVAGDFCGHGSMRSSVLAGAGAFVAGSNGVTTGAFAWADPTQTSLSSTGQGAPTGFIHRDQSALITAFLGDDTMQIAPGYGVTAANYGDFWVINSGTTTSAVGNTAYANYTTGLVSFGTSAPTSGSGTASTVALIVSAATGGALPTTNTCTGSITGNVLTVSAVGAGAVLGKGQTISGGSGANIIDTNTTILNQLTGTAGSTGTYTVSISQTVTSITITMSGGGLTLTGANTTGVFAIGMTLAGTNIPAGTTITGYGTATAGGAGTYTVSTVASVAATASTITAQNAMFLTVGGTVTGTFFLNDLLVGAGIPTTGTLSYISATNAQNANVTGTGGAGTYLATGFYTAVTSETITVNTGVATKWQAMSIAAPGSLVKMSTQLLG